MAQAWESPAPALEASVLPCAISFSLPEEHSPCSSPNVHLHQQNLLHDVCFWHHEHCTNHVGIAVLASIWPAWLIRQRYGSFEFLPPIFTNCDNFNNCDIFQKMWYRHFFPKSRFGIFLNFHRRKRSFRRSSSYKGDSLPGSFPNVRRPWTVPCPATLPSGKKERQVFLTPHCGPTITRGHFCVPLPQRVLYVMMDRPVSGPAETPSMVSLELVISLSRIPFSVGKTRRRNSVCGLRKYCLSHLSHLSQLSPIERNTADWRCLWTRAEPFEDFTGKWHTLGSRVYRTYGYLFLSDIFVLRQMNTDQWHLPSFLNHDPLTESHELSERLWLVWASLCQKWRGHCIYQKMGWGRPVFGYNCSHTWWTIPLLSFLKTTSKLICYVRLPEANNWHMRSCDW